MNKHEAMREYVSNFPPISDQWLYFQYLETEHGMQAIEPISFESSRRDVLGNKIMQYDFGIALVRNISSTSDDVNTDNMYFIDQWQDWIDEQNYNYNFPDFGSEYLIESIENLSSMGNLAQAYDNGTGKYIFLCRVNYIKEVN